MAAQIKAQVSTEKNKLFSQSMGRGLRPGVRLFDGVDEDEWGPTTNLGPDEYDFGQLLKERAAKLASLGPSYFEEHFMTNSPQEELVFKPKVGTFTTSLKKTINLPINEDDEPFDIARFDF